MRAELGWEGISWDNEVLTNLIKRRILLEYDENAD
jgi:hypothetical protein